LPARGTPQQGREFFEKYVIGEWLCQKIERPRRESGGILVIAGGPIAERRSRNEKYFKLRVRHECSQGNVRPAATVRPQQQVGDYRRDPTIPEARLNLHATCRRDGFEPATHQHALHQGAKIEIVFENDDFVPHAQLPAPTPDLRLDSGEECK